MKVKLLSRVRLFATPWTAAHQAPLSVSFSRQEYWSELPHPLSGDLPGGSVPLAPTAKPFSIPDPHVILHSCISASPYLILKVTWKVHYDQLMEMENAQA